LELGKLRLSQIGDKAQTMNDKFPIIVSVIGAIISFAFAVKLRHFRVPERPPASRAGLSVEERQQKIRIASWFSFSCGCLMLALAAYLVWDAI
jgi:hypothetical protein